MKQRNKEFCCPRLDVSQVHPMIIKHLHGYQVQVYKLISFTYTKRSELADQMLRRVLHENIRLVNFIVKAQHYGSQDL